MIVPRNDLSQSSATAAAIRELEAAIERGESQSSEKILQQFPTVYSDEESLLELLYTEFVIRSESGTQSDSDLIGEFQTRFPHLHEKLDELFRVGKVLSPLFSDDTRSTHRNGGSNSRRSNRDASSVLEDLGDYELLEVIGQGGMGVVYRARQRKLDRFVAVKTIDTLSSLNPAAVARFRSEAELVAKLQHPNIVQVYEIGSQSGVPYFSMELITGGTLAEATSERPLVPTTAAKILETVARAVHYAHSQSIVHRDLKPSNILLALSDRKDAIEIPMAPSLAILHSVGHAHRVEPKIVDFGLAKYLEGALTQTATQAMIGTPSYMAPELIDSELGDVGPACDVYSLGAILYGTLAGRPPFHAATVIETIQQVRNSEVIPPSKLQTNIPRDLETICLKCLQKEPSNRYASAKELANDLQRFLAGQPIQARPASAIEQGWKWAGRHPAVASLIAVSCIAAIAMTGLWLHATSSLAKADRASELGSRTVYAQTIRLAQSDLTQGDWQSAISRLEETKPEYRKFEWNLLSRQASKPIFMQTNPMMTNSLAFSPDGKWIAAAQRGPFGNDKLGTCCVWDIDSGREVYRFGGHPAGVNTVRFSPDGKFIATGGVVHSIENQFGGLNVWGASDGKLHFSDENADVYSLAFAPDGKTFATGSYSGFRIDIYSLDDKCKIRTLKGHKSFISDLAYSPDGKLLASAGRDGVMRLWSMSEGVPEPQVIGENAFTDLRHVEWSKDGQELIASDFHRAIHHFTRRVDSRGDSHFIQTGLTESAGVNAIRVSPDGQYLATAGEGGVPLITDRVTKAVLGSVKSFGHTFDIAFDGPGRRIAVASGYSVQVWDLEQCFHKSTLQSSPNPDVVALDRHPFKDQVALAYGVNLRRRSNASGVPRFDLVDIETNDLIKSMEHGKDWPTCVSFTPDGSKIVSGDKSGKVRLWNTSDGSQIHEIAAHDEAVVGVLAPGKSDAMITCGSDKWLRAWSMNAGSPINKLELDELPIRMSGSRQSSVFAIQTAWGVRIFDALSLKEIGNVPTGAVAIARIKVSEDGRWIAIADENNAISIWDLAGLIEKSVAEPLWRMRGHTYGINDLVFSRDSTRLASAGTDRTVRLWDVTSGRELINLPVLGQGLNPYIVFSRDDSSLRVWDMSQRYYWRASSEDEGGDPIADRDWHIEQLSMARRTNRKLHDVAVPNRFAEQFHLSRLMELEPFGNWQRQRGMARYQAGDLQGSYDDLQEVHQRLLPDLKSAQGLVANRLKSLASPTAWKNPKNALEKLTAPLADLPLLSLLAKCALGLEKLDEYHHWCQQLKAAYEADKSIVHLNTYAWVVGLDPSNQSDWKQIGQQFKQFGTVANQPIYLNTRALIEYRGGHYKEALKLSEPGARKSIKSNIPFDWVIAGMCYAQLSNLKDARRMQDRVEEWSANQDLLHFSSLKGLGNAESNPVPDRVLRKEFYRLLEDQHQ